MAIFIKRSLLFLLFTVFFYVTVLLLWAIFMPSFVKYAKPNLITTGSINGHMYTRLNEVKSVYNVDILFLGSSHVYRGFDPRIFKESGYSSFNLGSSGQTPMQALVLLKRYLDKLNPKLLVLEVCPLSFSSDGVESTADIIASEKNDKHSLRMALSVNHLKIYNTLIYRFICDIFSLNKNFKEPIIKGADTYVSGGFVEKQLSYYSPVARPNTKPVIIPEQLEAFNECLNMVSKKHIPVILIYVSIAPSEYKRYTNSQEFDLRMNQFSAMNQYLKYYNFNKIISLDDSLHFYDAHHLNQGGVEIVNKKLIELIQNESLLSR